MLKQIIAIILLSLIVIFTMTQIQHGLQWLISGYEWVSQQLMNVFSGGSTGNLIRNLLALLTIPLLVGLVPVAIYWLAKRKWFPYFMEMVWVIWLVQASAIIVLFKAS
jgi:hypothetical protein